jgi:hypothetical protein
MHIRHLLPITVSLCYLSCRRGRCVRDHMIVGYVQSVPIATKVVSSNPVHGEVYSIQQYVIKFVSDLRQVSGFLQFPPPIKLTATI